MIMKVGIGRLKGCRNYFKILEEDGAMIDGI